jgi:hypothetical protein
MFNVEWSWIVKVLIVVLFLLGASYYVISHHSPFQTEVTDPYYVEIRIDVPVRATQLQFVGVGRMNSLADCQARSMIVWANMLEHMGEVSVDTECKKKVAQKYMKLFDNKQATATYLAYDKGEGGERDGRFLIYGAPSSMAYEACKQYVEKATRQTSYSGQIYCIKGSVG